MVLVINAGLSKSTLSAFSISVMFDSVKVKSLNVIKPVSLAETEGINMLIMKRNLNIAQANLK